MSEHTDAGGARSDEERAKAALEQLKSIHAFDLAYEMMVGLVSFGYQKMGLTAETAPVRDLADARLAIELFRATLAVIEREEGEERTRDLHATLAQMQLGYASAVGRAGPSGATAARPAAEEPPSGAGGGGGTATAAAGAEDVATGPPDASGAAATVAAEASQPSATEPAEPETTTPAGTTPAAGKKPAAKKKAAATKRPAAKKKPAAGKKPAADAPPADEG
jgi:hypothetical protein